jgi:hypothetical protein
MEAATAACSDAPRLGAGVRKREEDSNLHIYVEERFSRSVGSGFRA